MFDYDDFTVGNANIGTTATAFNLNNAAGTLTVPARYRLRFKQWAVNGIAAGTLTIKKSNGTLGSTVTVFGPTKLTAGQYIPSDQLPELIVESGYYLFGIMSGGSASVVGTGEYVPG